MPSKQKRFVCIYCGSKRVESKLTPSFTRSYKGFKWHCNLALMPLGATVETYCSKRTPQVKFYK